MKFVGEALGWMSILQRYKVVFIKENAWQQSVSARNNDNILRRSCAYGPAH